MQEKAKDTIPRKGDLALVISSPKSGISNPPWRENILGKIVLVETDSFLLEKGRILDHGDHRVTGTGHMNSVVNFNGHITSLRTDRLIKINPDDDQLALFRQEEQDFKQEQRKSSVKTKLTLKSKEKQR